MSPFLSPKKQKKLQIFAALLMVLSFFISAPTATAQTADVGRMSEIWLRLKDSIGQGIQTGISVAEKYRGEVLDALAIGAVRIAGEKLNNATYQWISGGFKNGKQLYIDSARDFGQSFIDEAIRIGLTNINLAITDAAYRLTNDAPLGAVPIGADFLPSWIIKYLEGVYKVPEEDVYLMIAGASMYESPAEYSIYGGRYCTGDTPTSTPKILIGQGECAAGATPAWDDLTSASCTVKNWAWDGEDPNSAQLTLPADACKPLATRWRIEVGLNTGEALTFASSGWRMEQTAFPVDENGVKTDNVSAKPIATRTFTNNKVNAFGAALTKTAVATYQSTLSGSIETTLKDILGPLWLDFANDVTIGYNKFDPYAGWDALLEAGNNPLGSAFTVANSIAGEADKRLQAAIQETTASGFLPDKTCKEDSFIKFPDGTQEKYCKLWDTKTPLSTVGESVGAAVTKAFDLPDGVTKWEQLGVQLLADATSAVITGGLELVAGEIKNKGNEMVTAVKQLGPFSSLYGQITEQITAGDQQAWQLLGSRDIDFSKINQQINTSYEEARLYAESAYLLEQTAAPLLVLDQQCVFGPDLGWEERLRSNFLDDTKRLLQETQKNTDSDGKKARAQRQLLSTLKKELETQVDFVNEAMPDNPFKYQSQFMAQVSSAQSEISQYSYYAEQAADKMNALNSLIEIRNIIEELGPTAAILTQEPPTWSDDPTTVFASGVADLGSLDIGTDRQSIDDLRAFDEQRNDATSVQFSKPTITVLRTNATVPHQDQEEPYWFNIMQGITVADAEDSVTEAGQEALEDYIINHITVTRSASLLDNPGFETASTTIDAAAKAVYIDISESYTVPERPAIPAVEPTISGQGAITDPGSPEIPGRPAFEAGYRYTITYELKDSSNNIVTATRNLRVKTYDQHLADLTEYNRTLQNYITSIPAANSRQKQLLSRAVNLYLSIEENIGSETSVRDAQGELQKITQLQTDIYDSLDLCYVELWNLDKRVPENLLPQGYVAVNNEPFVVENKLGGTTTITSNIDVLNDTFHQFTPQQAQIWGNLQAYLGAQLREDSRIPYVKQTLSITRPEMTSVPGNISDLETNYTQDRIALTKSIAENSANGIGSWLWKDFLGFGDGSGQAQQAVEGVRAAVGNLLKPNVVNFSAPDFVCALDPDAFRLIENQCNFADACIEKILVAYEDYHCISRINDKEIFSVMTSGVTINRDIIREITRIDNGPGRAASPAYTPGRMTLGQYDWFRNKQRMLMPFGDGISFNTVSYIKVFPDWFNTAQNDADCKNDNSSFRRAVLGSTSNCSDFIDPLIHTKPRVPDAVKNDGLSVTYWPLAQFSRELHPADLYCGATQQECDASAKDQYRHDNPNLARSLNYTYPYTLSNFTWDNGPSIGNAPPAGSLFLRTYDLPTTTIKVYSFDPYKENSEQRLYCRHRTILFQPITNYNRMFGLDNSGPSDNWWTGGFESDGTPETGDIGDRDNWGEVQNCSAWTVSDLSTYLDYPKQEI